MPAATIAHLTSHHNILDNRIFYRECCSLADAGYNVVLIAQHDRDETRNGVRICAVPPYRNRLERVTLTAFRVVRRAWRERPAIFHFHDPELIPWGFLLHLLGKQVIYDVHEDFSQAAGVRPWLPRRLRPLLARAVEVVNHVARRSFTIVIAERYYARSFPGALEVLNYAKLEDYAKVLAIRRAPEQLECIRLLYSGSVTESRGALHLLSLLDHLPATAQLHLIGQCAVESLRGRLEATAQGEPRLRLEIGAGWVPYAKILSAYEEPWLAGLALFPDSPHYREKELTKFFEYMAAGLPIVCSDFPAWRAIVEQHGVGLCVDPEQPAAAIHWLAEHPIEAAAMGERGRRLVRERFNWDCQARGLLGLYRQLLDPDLPTSAGPRLNAPSPPPPTS